MPRAWLRYDLTVEPVPASLYRILAETTGRLLADGAVGDAFFVHTPAGLRLRCDAADGAATDAAWRSALTGAERRGWLRGWRPATHEPEQGLGGPGAMASTHRVFTADSVAWLGYHSDPERPAPTIARWAMSVLMIRSMLTAAGRSGWEVADVWDRIARTDRLTARSTTRSGAEARRPATASRLAVDPAMRRLAGAVRGGWDEPDLLRERLSADQRDLLAGFEATVRSAAADWLAAPAAGPMRRHGVALAVTFHWNRSAMPARHRRLLATALAGAARPDLELVAC
jgi:thiopeptide-type bacteriocin biosynthesis protein